MKLSTVFVHLAARTTASRVDLVAVVFVVRDPVDMIEGAIVVTEGVVIVMPEALEAFLFAGLAARALGKDIPPGLIASIATAVPAGLNGLHQGRDAEPGDRHDHPDSQPAKPGFAGARERDPGPEPHGGKASVHLIHKWPDEAIHVQTEKDLPFGVFTHLAFTYDGSGKAAGLTIYVNGEPVKTVVQKDKLTGSITTPAPFSIGHRGGAAAPFTGSVDDLRIFSRALAPNEMRAGATMPPNAGRPAMVIGAPPFCGVPFV